MRVQLISFAAWAVLAVVLAANASAAPSFVIRRDANIGGFSLAHDGTLKGAIATFGTPTSRQPFSGGWDVCIVAWKQLGIESTYAYSHDDPCSPRGCHSETTINERQWKTDKGLHIGDTLKRLRQLYPKAKQYVGRNWALISRPFGGTRVPTLLATVNSGRITVLTVRSPWLLVC
jgi:hypothetical protein